jgi:putative aldouronate transport system substrate-binding protein
MRKSVFNRAVSLSLCGAMTAAMLAGCGQSSSGSTAASAKEAGGSSAAETSTAASSEKAASTKTYKDELTVDVFDSQANFQGLQSGWFAKMIKDKFNMKLNIIAPNVAGGGDTLYQTRSANGDLGDLIITNIDKSRLKDMVSAGLIADMTPYMKECPHLSQYSEAIKDASKLAGTDGTWAVPSEISNQSPTKPCEAEEATNAPSLRWDIYAACGYPDIKTLDDLPTVLKEMQDKAGKSDSGKKVYAFSLFKDWDGDIMQNATGLTGLYGYYPMGFCMAKADGSDVQSDIDDNSIYIKALKTLYTANQMGLVDPESTTQNFDTLSAKYKDGAVLYSMWPWLGAGQYNVSANTDAGKGFKTATIDDMQCLSYGSMPLGKMEVAMMIGSKAKDPQRLADFIDWLYSPEGIETALTIDANTAGPEGLTWEMKDNKSVLTDFGVKAFITKPDNLEVPAEWGGGTWSDGASKLNIKTAGIVDCDPDTGMCYNYLRWDDYRSRVETKLSKDWSAHNGNAASGIDYLTKNNKVLVIPGTNYATPEYTTDISTIKEQCKQSIVEYSWKMVFAKDDAEFSSLLKEMQNTVKGLGYDQVLAVDKQNCKDKFAAEATLVKASGK